MIVVGSDDSDDEDRIGWDNYYNVWKSWIRVLVEGYVVYIFLVNFNDNLRMYKSYLNRLFSS